MPSETWGLPFFVSHPCSVAGWSLQPACGRTDNLRHGDLQRALLEPQGQREEEVLTARAQAGHGPHRRGRGKRRPAHRANIPLQVLSQSSLLCFWMTGGHSESHLVIVLLSLLPRWLYYWNPVKYKENCHAVSVKGSNEGECILNEREVMI